MGKEIEDMISTKALITIQVSIYRIVVDERSHLSMAGQALLADVRVRFDIASDRAAM